MKCKNKVSSKNNLTQKLKQLKKHREKFEEQQEKQGCRYPYHRKVKSDVPIAKDTTANVVNPAIRADSIFDVKSPQAVAEVERSSARGTAVIAFPDSFTDSKSASDTVMTDVVRAGMAKTNAAVTAFTASSASTSRFSKFVDVSKERPDKRFHRLEIWFAGIRF